MRSIKLPSGNELPVFGLGSWRMGEHKEQFHNETRVIHEALELGVTLIDTAEMYGAGGAEQMIGEAIKGRRDGLCLVTKVYPHNASRTGVIKACERSLRRLQCEVIDLYLLHWPGSIPLSETFDGFHELQNAGKIRDFGVSNFDIPQLQAIPEADQVLLGCNQVFYNLAHREVEWKVAPWCQQRGIPVMAYSPLDQASSLLQSPAIADIATRHSATSAQIALSWLLHQPDTVVIPKSTNLGRIRENLEAMNIKLSIQDLSDLDNAFPTPDQAISLDMR